MCAAGSFPEATGLEANHTSSLNADVKTERSYNATPRYVQLLGVMLIEVLKCVFSTLF
jgi:hypothetical protein